MILQCSPPLGLQRDEEVYFQLFSPLLPPSYLCCISADLLHMSGNILAVQTKVVKDKDVHSHWQLYASILSFRDHYPELFLLPDVNAILREGLPRIWGTVPAYCFD